MTYETFTFLIVDVSLLGWAIQGTDGQIRSTDVKVLHEAIYHGAALNVRANFFFCVVFVYFFTNTMM